MRTATNECGLAQTNFIWYALMEVHVMQRQLKYTVCGMVLQTYLHFRNNSHDKNSNKTYQSKRSDVITEQAHTDSI